jgi:hypothetical protein
MTDHRDSYDGTEPDPDADRWSAWLPPLDVTSDRTGAADSGPRASTPPSPAPGTSLPQSTGPRLPQSAGPAVPPSPAPAQWSFTSYRFAPPPAPAAPATRVVVAGPQRHLGLAIFATFFGFPPLGIVAIVLALSVARLHRTGRTAESERASRRARSWAIAALVLKVLWMAFYAFVLGS